mmetsp:Transcript_52666/g.146015  ORF Transcript_52666/g.146015 Transcript_52666/m.146015 type:complete len:230 (-) Transcript_52666:439-1128(-)
MVGRGRSRHRGPVVAALALLLAAPVAALVRRCPAHPLRAQRTMPSLCGTRRAPAPAPSRPRSPRLPRLSAGPRATQRNAGATTVTPRLRPRGHPPGGRATAAAAQGAARGLRHPPWHLGTPHKRLQEHVLQALSQPHCNPNNGSSLWRSRDPQRGCGVPLPSWGERPHRPCALQRKGPWVHRPAAPLPTQRPRCNKHLPQGAFANKAGKGSSWRVVPPPRCSCLLTGCW